MMTEQSESKFWIFEGLAQQVDFSTAQMTSIMEGIMGGYWLPEEITAFLLGMRMKGESVEELTAGALVMRKLAVPVHVEHPYLIDTCGTGGDGANLLNVSTAVSFVAAAAGAGVAKHGNRSVSSKSGAADVLEAAGVFLGLNAAQVARAVKDIGVGFLFAPNHHQAMKHAIGPRQTLGIRTLFNLLGPLSNPAGVPNQLLGVFSPEWVKPMIHVLKNLGLKRAVVVSGAEGLDEFSIAGPSHYGILNEGEITFHELSPETYGMSLSSLEPLKVANGKESLARIQAALKKQPNQVQDPARNIIALNAGVALFVAGCVNTIAQGVDLAQDVMASGAALERLSLLRDYTSVLKP